jgi:hypothetical protein
LGWDALGNRNMKIIQITVVEAIEIIKTLDTEIERKTILRDRLIDDYHDSGLLLTTEIDELGLVRNKLVRELN